MNKATYQNLLNKSVIIAGDMNVDISAANSSTSYYLNSLRSLFYIPVITKPTRYIFSESGVVSTTLDHIFINRVASFQSAVFSYDLSDHLGTAVVFDESSSEIEKNHHITFRPYSDANFDKLVDRLVETDWDPFLMSEDINLQFDNFIEYLDKLYCDCFPLKCKQISAKRRANPWVTDETLKKIRQKSTYFHLMKNGFITKAENNAFKNKLNKEIQRDKRNYYQNLFNNAKQNMTKSF